jgi:hypothetical protein
MQEDPREALIQSYLDRIEVLERELWIAKARAEGLDLYSDLAKCRIEALEKEWK